MQLAPAGLNQGERKWRLDPDGAEGMTCEALPGPSVEHAAARAQAAADFAAEAAC